MDQNDHDGGDLPEESKCDGCEFEHEETCPIDMCPYNT